MLTPTAQYVRSLSLIILHERLQAESLACGHPQPNQLIICLFCILRKQHLLGFAQTGEIPAYLLNALTSHQTHNLIVNLLLLISLNRRMDEERWLTLHLGAFVC